MSAWQSDGNEITGKVLAVAGVIAALALVVGFAVGMYLGRSSAPDLRTLAGQAHGDARALQTALAPARAAYDAAVPNGTIADPTGYTDAQGRIAKVRARLSGEQGTFEALSAGDYRRAVAVLAALQAKATTPVPPAEFDAAFAEAQAALGALAGG